MGLGIHVQTANPIRRPGEHASFDAQSERIAAWFADALGDDLTAAALGTAEDGVDELRLELHTAGEPLRVRPLDDGTLLFETKTSTVGPAYHAWVVDLLKRWGAEHGAGWRLDGVEPAEVDDTGYFFTGDLDQLRAAMLRQAQAMAGQLAQMLRDERAGYANIMINMNVDVMFDSGAPVLTPLGPRDLAWAERVARRPEAGVDLFPWWDADEAGYRLSRALPRMWTEVHWVPALTDAAAAIQADAASQLWRAYQADPSRGYPWHEWLELLHLLPDGASHPAYATVASMAGGSPEPRTPIGYRRGDVTLHLNGWRVTLPGAMQLIQDPGAEGSDAECPVWSDGDRSVHVQLFRAEGEVDLAELVQPQPGDRVIELREPDRRGRALHHRSADDGESVSGPIVSAGRSMALVTAAYASPDDAAWAERVWRSARPPAAP
jgi:hypothetical protein